jgi:hypothetical protein
MSWRGIPSQVKASDAAGATVSRLLPGSFQQEIDRVAMAEGLMDTDAYLDGWSWSDPAERPGSAADVVEAVVAELIEQQQATNVETGSTS